MFGYVTPCQMELKIKDYEKFKAYYCGLCKSIKKNYGNLPRLALNYDMTFLAVLLDSLSDKKNTFEKQHCITHPFKQKLIISNNSALDYAAFFNVTLAYFKLLDNVTDDGSAISKFKSLFLKANLNRTAYFDQHFSYISNKLTKLYKLENNCNSVTLDEISHPFAELTGYILSSYPSPDSIRYDLYWIGYYLGKWIYIIDAWDDLEKDLKNGKFNAINKVFNSENLTYPDLHRNLEQRIDFVLTSCGSQCLKYLSLLPLKKNQDILSNIIQHGLMEKMDKVFKRSETENEKPI